MMKKLLYIAPIKDIERNSIGVYKKINIQKKVLESFNINTKYIDISSGKNKLLEKICIRLPFFGVPGSWKMVIKENDIDIDIVYIRYMISNYQMIKCLKKIKKNKPSVKILVEIPTYPYENERLNKLASKPLLWKDKYNRRKLVNYVDRIITYSDDKSIFGIKTIKISNGIDINKVKEREVKCNDNEINIIAVALFAKWHGYDRIIEGLKNYYRNSNLNKIIKIHFVGDGEEIKRYKEMVKSYNLNEYVKFYGRLDGVALDDIYNKCDIGLDAMGRHRSGVYYNSSIKGKEYIGKGLPVISGVSTELDSDFNFKYYFRVAADESPINIEEVIGFYESIYNCEISKIEVSNKIRKYAEDNFNIIKCFEPVIEYIREEQ